MNRVATNYVQIPTFEILFVYVRVVSHRHSNKCAAEPRFVYLWADILPGLDFRLWGVTQYFSEQLLRNTF